MYWVWWLAICFVVLAAVGVTLFCFGYRYYCKHEDDYDWDECPARIGFGAVMGVISLIGFIVCAAVGGKGEYDRYHEPRYWQNFYTMCSEVVESGNSITNARMTERIIEYNKWLVDARTDQEVKGMWSKYHGVDLSDFEYITLSGGTDFDINIGMN